MYSHYYGPNKPFYILSYSWWDTIQAESYYLYYGTKLGRRTRVSIHLIYTLEENITNCVRT